MFDAPDNLPVEPGSRSAKPQAPETPAPSPEPQKMEGGINVSGTKEPEDIFADINEPVQTPPQTPAPGMQPSAPKSGFPWKLVLGIIIPLAVIGLGVGGYYFFKEYFAGQDAALVTDSGKNVAPTTIPSTSEPSDSPPVNSPIPEPDEDRLAASQASMALLKAQAEQEQMQMEMATTSEMPEMQLPTEMSDLETATSSEAPEMMEIQDQSVVLSPGVDSDEDGLTNSEELLLGTDPNLADSDNDGYNDGSEFLNGYDPAAPQMKLQDSSAIKIETIGTMNFTMPAAWKRNPGPAGSVILYTGTPASINVSMATYANGESLLDWLIKNNPQTSNDDYVMGNNKNGAELVFASDELIAWLLMGNTIYTLKYTPNGASSLDFLTLFKNLSESAISSK